MKETKFDKVSIKLWEWGKINENMRAFPWRNKSASVYEKVIAEFLLQRTKAETVSSFFPFFIKKYPDWKTLASNNIEDLKQVISEIGLQNQRAPRLKKAAEFFTLASNIPEDHNTLREISGIGHYIASAILLFYHHLPEPLLDGSSVRLIERLFDVRTKVDFRYDEKLWSTSRQLISKFDKPEEANWILLDFATKICKKQPLCDICTLQKNCKYFTHQ